tara:strand:- start:16161 stop:16319 length:159 start_codon:yes stop_codon:yes gene_type:complete
MPQHTPPIVLVQTWLQLLNSGAEKEAQTHAKRMLDGAFGSIDLAIEYIEQTN